MNFVVKDLTALKFEHVTLIHKYFPTEENTVTASFFSDKDLWGSLFSTSYD